MTLIAIATLISCGSEKTLDELEAEKKELITSQKQVVRDYKLALHKIDSTIENHTEYGKKTNTIKKIPVTADTITRTIFEHFFEVHGNVKVEKNATLYPEVPGNIKTIHAKEGQIVKKGDLIISLDAAVIKSSIKELQTSYDLVDKLFEKQSKLWAQKIGSELQYLEAKSNKESLSQKLKTTKKQLAMYQITAPFSGTVDDVYSKIGEAASPGFPLVRIINLDQVYLEADVSEKYLNSVKKGGFVEVHLSSSGEVVMAKVKRTGNFINPANRTFKVRVEFSNPNGKYKPNQLAVLKIRDYKADKAVVIPSRIIQQDRSGQDYLYTFEKDAEGIHRVKKINLTIGKSYKGMSEILKGVTGKIPYVNKGAKSIQSGDAIEIKN